MLASPVSAPFQSPTGAARSAKTEHIPEFDGLRGILAWWVVLAHVITDAPVSELPRGLRILWRGDYAVALFILLSGWVIFKLLCESRETYLVFIVRRFFRLYPVYLLCLTLAILLRPCEWHALHHGALTRPEFFGEKLSHWSEIGAAMGRHLLGHLTLLHGAIPESILPNASSALLAPAWSLSLEWQFYLVAPLLAAAILKFGSRALLLLTGSLIALRFVGSIQEMHSFLPSQLEMFAAGFISYFIAAIVPRGPVGHVVMGMAPLVLIFSWNPPLAIWCAVFGIVIAEGDGVATWPRAFLCSPFLQRLGTLSYCTYLGHQPILYAVQSLILLFAPAASPRLMFPLLLATGAVAVYVFSEIAHRFIEAPGIRLGRQMAARLRPQPTCNRQPAVVTFDR